MVVYVYVVNNGRFLDGEKSLLFMASYNYERKKHYKLLLVDFDMIRNGFKEISLPNLDSEVLSVSCLPTYLPHTHCYLLTENLKAFSIMALPGQNPRNLNNYKLIAEEDLSKWTDSLFKPEFITGSDYFALTDKAKPTSFMTIHDGLMNYADSNHLAETHPCHGAKTVGASTNSLCHPVLLFQDFTGNTCFTRLKIKI